MPSYLRDALLRAIAQRSVVRHAVLWLVLGDELNREGRLLHWTGKTGGGRVRRLFKQFDSGLCHYTLLELENFLRRFSYGVVADAVALLASDRLADCGCVARRAVREPLIIPQGREWKLEAILADIDKMPTTFPPKPEREELYPHQSVVVDYLKQRRAPEAAAGVHEIHIELVLEQVPTATREQAIAAIEMYNGDIVNAIMELTTEGTHT